MQRNPRKTLSSLVIAITAAAALLLGGCEGDKGDPGPPGRDLTGFTNISSLSPQQQAGLERLNGEVTSVTISSPPVVRFRITDRNGTPVTGLGSRNATNGQLTNLAFSLAKLVPGSNGSPSQWVNYLVTTVPTATSPTVAATRPTRDREGALVDLGDGNYQYTFARDITQVQSQVNALTFTGNNRRADLGDLTYQPSLTHRLVIEYGGDIPNTEPELEIRNALNIVYDFVPATGARVTSANAQREIVLTKYCNECHGDPGNPDNLNEQGWGLGVTTPHAGRVDTRYCAICHTSQRAYGRAVSTPTAGAFTGNTYVTADTSPPAAGEEPEVLGEFVTLVHKIHMGSNLTETGYNYAGVQFNNIHYPQSAALCRRCHRADTAEEQAVTPQGNNWRTAPSRKACGSCHDNIHFATGTNTEVPADDPHPVQLNDASCTACHTSTEITQKHAQALVSPLNPEAPAGLANFTYEIAEATVDAGNVLTVRFRILQDGTPVTLTTPGPGVTTALTGFTGSPSFVFAYAMPQLETGAAAPVDFNNLGRPAAQPDILSITTLLNTNNAAQGSISSPDASGYYTATITAAAVTPAPRPAFPVGAAMRTVALQSYFTQTGFDATVAGRHAVAVFRTVTGDTPRRVVVDPAKCRNCHEYFEAHGGQRVYETQVCVTCHNPNLTTSGRTITDARLSTFAFTPLQLGILTTWDPAFNAATPGYALTFAEFSNNFKDLIHGIHAGSEEEGGIRTDPLRDVRFGPGTNITLLSGEEIVFPNMLARCDACHASEETYIPDAVEALRGRVLPSTQVVRSATSIATPSAENNAAARTTVPNPEDLVLAPVTAACIACHDSPLAKAHMQANGAQLGAGLTGPSYTDLGVARTNLPSATEQCVLCHGRGRIADVIVEHAQDMPAVATESTATSGSSAARSIVRRTLSLLNW